MKVESYKSILVEILYTKGPRQEIFWDLKILKIHHVTWELFSICIFLKVVKFLAKLMI